MRRTVYALTAVIVVFAARWGLAAPPVPLAENLARSADLAAALPWQPAAPRAGSRGVF